MPGKIHTDIRGIGVPPVVLEAGIAASSVSWALVQPELAKHTTVIAYDRAGFGLSEPALHKSTALDAVNDLKTVLGASGVPGPYVLVGHSFGGLIVRLFQQVHPELVSGLVLLDPVARSEWHQDSGISEDRRRMLSRGVMLSRRGAWLARVGVVGLALRALTGGSQRLPMLLAKASSGRGAGVATRLVGEVKKLPAELWPVVAQHWSQPKSFIAMANSLESLPFSATQLDETRTLGDLPVAVLSSSLSTPAALQEHAREAKLSTRGSYQILQGAGHWLQLDAPEAVCAAVLAICGIHP